MGRAIVAVVAIIGSCAGSVSEAAADSSRTRIPRADCRYLVQHQPGPGVAYQPGADVRGKPVAPADLPGGGFQAELPRHVEFDISFNPLRGATGRRFNKTELHVGTIRYDMKTGQATFNGVPLTDPQKDEVAHNCRSVLRQR